MSDPRGSESCKGPGLTRGSVASEEPKIWAFLVSFPLSHTHTRTHTRTPPISKTHFRSRPCAKNFLLHDQLDLSEFHSRKHGCLGFLQPLPPTQHSCERIKHLLQKANVLGKSCGSQALSCTLDSRGNASVLVVLSSSSCGSVVETCRLTSWASSCDFLPGSSCTDSQSWILGRLVLHWHSTRAG